jgi:hypothetical protein
MIKKARRAAVFLSWYYQTSLPKDRFVFTLHARSILSSILRSMVVVLKKYNKKKGVKGCRVLLSHYYIASRYHMYVELMSQFLMRVFFCLYITESFSWYLQSFPVASIIDRCFSHAMKNCALSKGSPKVFFFFSLLTFSFWKF